MQITLNIKDDAELRNYMKDYLKSLVKSISREDVERQIIEAAVNKINGLSHRDLKDIISIDDKVKIDMVRTKVDSFVTEDFNRITESRVTEINRTASHYARSYMQDELYKVKKEIFTKLF